MPGAGIVAEPLDTLHIVAYALVPVGGAVAAIVLFAKPRRSRIAVGSLGALILVALGASLLLLPAPKYGPVIGAHAGTVWLAADDDEAARESAVIVASPGEAFAMTISFENAGPLPMRILGLI